MANVRSSCIRVDCSPVGALPHTKPLELEGFCGWLSASLYSCQSLPKRRLYTNCGRVLLPFTRGPFFFELSPANSTAGKHTTAVCALHAPFGIQARCPPPAQPGPAQQHSALTINPSIVPCAVAAGRPPWATGAEGCVLWVSVRTRSTAAWCWKHTSQSAATSARTSSTRCWRPHSR